MSVVTPSLPGMKGFSDDGATPHPLMAGVGVFSWVLDDITGIDPAPLPLADKARLLLEVSRLVERLQGFKLVLVAASDEVCEVDGSRDVASWLASRVNVDHDQAYADQVLACALDSRWRQVAAALRDGDCSVDQARVIVTTLDRLLPGDPGVERLARVEASLVTAAAQHTPSELRRLGDQLLQDAVGVGRDERVGRVSSTRRAG